jgi:hypothetical protein
VLELDEITSSESPRDPGLSGLQGQIKNVMIPLLIKIFQLRLEVQQTTSPPSRLQSSKPRIALDDLIGQLLRLDEDLKLLHIWNQSCQTQLEKVLQEAKEGTASSLGYCVKQDYKEHPAIRKSFQDVFPVTQPPLRFWKQCFKKIGMLLYGNRRNS